MDNTIPVIILTGSLGSGKTTALNQLLNLPDMRTRQIALIINEFGNISIDSGVVQPGDYTKYEINKGSIFCVCTKTDFLRILRDIAENTRPEMVIIEASGVADPADLEQFLTEPALGGKLSVQANICIADAANFVKIAACQQTASRQAKYADEIIINKTDMVPPIQVAKLTEIIQQMNPQARITPTTYSRLEHNFTAGLQHRTFRSALTPCRDINLAAVSFQTDKTVDREKFLNTVRRLNDNIPRLKGNIDFGSGLMFVEKIYDQITEQPGKNSLPGRTRFSVIGWKINQQRLKNQIEQTFL